MRNKEKDAAQMAIKRRDFLAKAYELFTKKNIESVTMVEVARESGYGTITLTDRQTEVLRHGSDCH